MAEADSNLSSLKAKNATIRISNIPLSLSRDSLRMYLEEVSFVEIAKDANDNPYLSLAPEASDSPRFQTATLTFSRLTTVPPHIDLGPPTPARFRAIIDTHFRGLTPLNNSIAPKIDIIAVTGLAGHAFGSWRSRENYAMWLRDYLPGDLEHNGYRARILTYGYDTTLIASHSHAEIYHFSKQFSEAVKGARSRDTTRPLILVGHSLGGLVIKEAIIQCFDDSNNSTLGSFVGILFFSVPHKGLADARLLSMVHGQPNENLVRDLCQNSQFLRGLDRCFGHHMNEMGANIISFYETEETRTVEEVSQGKWSKSGPYVRMVTEESVKHGAGGGQYLPMDADHSSIVKFNDRSGQKYHLACDKLLVLARTISIAAPETKVPCEERIKVCEWLYPGAVDKKHTEIQSKRQENTGGWLIADDRFTSWKGGSGPRLLWGCGIPGAGKTFLSSLVIDVFKASSSASSSTGLAYIYFDYRDRDQQIPIVVLRCLIKQLVASPHALDFPIPGPVRSLYDKSCASGTTPQLKDLETALAASLKFFTEAFFVFDALDECREDIRKDLLSLIHWIAGSGGRIFVTSRPHVAISLTRTTDSDVQRLDLEAKEEDVTVYIEGTIQRHNKARDRITGDLRAKVVSRLVGACNGM